MCPDVIRNVHVPVASSVRNVQLSADGQRMAFTLSSTEHMFKTVRVLETVSCRQLAAFQSDTESVSVLRLSPSGKYVACKRHFEFVFFLWSAH